MAANNGEQQQERSGLQNVIRVISILPCFPSYQPKPPTPNFDQVMRFQVPCCLNEMTNYLKMNFYFQLKEILNRFRTHDPNQTDLSVLDRTSSTDLCVWTQKVLTFLPSVDDVPESDAETRDTLTHFNTIKV